MRRYEALLLQVVALGLLGGCELLSSAAGDVVVIEGQVVDTEGKPIEGARLQTFGFLENLDSMRWDGDRSNARDPDNARVRVNVANLQRRGRVGAIATSDADGRFRIDKGVLDGLIVTAVADSYSTDIEGMDPADGTVSMSSVLRIRNIDVSNLQVTLAANFVLAGGPVADEEGPSDDVRAPPPIAAPAGDLPEPPQSIWTTFTLADEADNIIADASAGPGMIAAGAGGRGTRVRIRAVHGDTTVERAVLRVQFFSAACGEAGHGEPKVHEIPVSLSGGMLVSDEGDYQPWFLGGGYEALQLDLDGIPDSGDESHVIRVEQPCQASEVPMVVTMTWDGQFIDTDLHVWDAAGEETWHGAYFDGTPGRSSYGAIQITDRLGDGPEVFTADAGQSGHYLVRAHFFCGAQPTADLQVNIRRWFDGAWRHDHFEATVGLEGWVDIGTFPVSPME